MTSPVDPARWPDAKRLFEAALGLRAQEREGFLEEACRDPDGTLDADLLAAVHVLLAADEAAGGQDEGGFLGTPVLSLREMLGGEPRPLA